MSANVKTKHFCSGLRGRMKERVQGRSLYQTNHEVAVFCLIQTRALNGLFKVIIFKRDSLQVDYATADSNDSQASSLNCFSSVVHVCLK